MSEANNQARLVEQLKAMIKRTNYVCHHNFDDGTKCGTRLIAVGDLAAEANRSIELLQEIESGGRQPAMTKTAEAKHVGISDLFGGFVVKIEPFMLWESARSQAMTSDNWKAAMLELEQALRRETTDTGSNRVYEMIDGCLADLQEKGVVRPMTDREVDQDAECPLYPPNAATEPSRQ